MMRVRINLTLDPSVMFRSFHIGLSRVIVVVHWAILDKISAFHDVSDLGVHPFVSFSPVGVTFLVL